MIFKIKGIRKWRVTNDDLAWIIQKKIPGRKPPNDWVNKYWCNSLESLMDTLVDLTIPPEKITDFKGMSTHASKIKRNLRGLIQDLFAKTGGKLPYEREIIEEKKPKKRSKK